jgi:amino acid transporter
MKIEMCDHYLGNIIVINDLEVGVVEACSGLRYLFPLASFGFLCAWLFKAPFWARAFVLLSTIPITIAISVLLIILTISYRQTIHTYPNGGGAYIVSRENLGELTGLTAAAALLVDYILTVAVSIAAGVAAITSAFEPLRPYTVELCVAANLLIALANLRGLKESGTIFAVPTYLFIGSLLVLIAVGLVKHFWLGGAILISQREPRIAIGTAAQGLTLFLLLRAYASGCTALTGVEAISNGIPAFKPPESRNSATTSASLTTFEVGCAKVRLTWSCPCRAWRRRRRGARRLRQRGSART